MISFGVLKYKKYQVLIGMDWVTINPTQPLFPQVRGMRGYRLIDADEVIVLQTWHN